MKPWQIAMVPVTVASSILMALAAVAQDPGEFRVETDVFVSGDKAPVSETLTLFSSDLIYDFLLTEPEEITILDVRRNRMVLLDTARRVKTTLSTNKLLQFTAAIKLFADQVEPQERELFEPQFVEQFDEANGEVVLSGVTLTYRATGIEPQNPEAVRQYREFADWYARLNALRRKLPPFARIELNRSLAQRGLLPQEVSRTVVTPQPLRDKKNVASSRHTFIWTLSNSDRKRIENAGTYQASYKAVPLNEYWDIPTIAAKTR